jgi:hypothetical protein
MSMTRMGKYGLKNSDIARKVNASGGVVATLVAAKPSISIRSAVHGSEAWAAICRIGKENIYRVAPDLDPISLIGPFAFIHVNAAALDRNNMTLRTQLHERMRRHYRRADLPALDALLSTLVAAIRQLGMQS